MRGSTITPNSGEVVHRLRRDGYRAVAVADDNSLVDREAAYRAGLGWFGRNANLLIDGAGSWFVLGGVVTNAALPPSADTPIGDGCGRCTRCIPACPTGAIVADGVIDASRCLAWVLQKPGSIPVDLRSSVGDRLYGCDDCQTACPPTVRFGPRQSANTDQPVRRSVPLVDLLEADDAQAVALWGRWYLADRDPRWIRRNALVVAGNVASAHNGADTALRAAIGSCAAGDDPILAEHAQWALRRIAERSASAAP
jgi:epoxyqueuosine reductase